jgi:trimethylamine--corrinoid protein Co-methyltransferase
MKGFTGKLVGSTFPITKVECEKVHKAAVRVLEEGGMRCDDPRAADMFKKVGCSVEKDGTLVKISEKVIMKAFETCPATFTIYGRDGAGENDINIGNGEVHFATVTGRYLRDIHTGKRRQANRADAVDGTIMADALNNVHGLYKAVMWLYDEPKICNSQMLVGEMMKYTEKSMTWVYNTGAEHEISDLIKIWQIAAGGEEAMRKKPHVLGHVIVNPPRVIDVNYTSWLIGFCDAGLPVTVYSALMGGATGPATLAGMLVQALAETLALVVQTQAYKPGHSLCFCSFNPAMDMRTGLWQFGNPEYGTVGAGLAAMAKYYGVPCVGFTINDSCDTDEQAAYESHLKNYTYALSDISLIWDIGGMAGFNYVDWAHMCIDNEVVSFIGQYVKGIEVDDDRLAVDEILKVGPLPGSYLKEKHTRMWYRKEFLIAELSNRDFFESWERGHTDLYEKGKQKALGILESHAHPVSSEKQKEIDDYLNFVKKRDVGEDDKPPKRKQ